MILVRLFCIFIAFPCLAMSSPPKIKGDSNPVYLQQAIDHQQRRETKNTGMLVLKRQTGDIYQAAFLKILHNATNDVLSLSNIDRNSISSLMASGFSYIDENGYQVMVLGREPTPEMLAAIKRDVRTANTASQWVSVDETATVIVAQFVAREQGSKNVFDRSRIRKELDAIRQKYESDEIKIHAFDFFDDENNNHDAGIASNDILPEDLPSGSWIQDLATCKVSLNEVEPNSSTWSYYARRAESDLVSNENNMSIPKVPTNIFGFPVSHVRLSGVGMAPGFAVVVDAPFDVVSSSITQQTNIPLSPCAPQDGCVTYDFSKDRSLILMAGNKSGAPQTLIGCIYPYRP